MTAVTVSRKEGGWSGSLKKLVVVCASPATGETYDANLDTHASAEFREIYNAVSSDPTNGEVSATWSNSTGVVTLGTITTTPAVGYIILEGK